LSFDIEAIKHGIEPADAPCRLKIVFGEILNDVCESFDDYRSVVLLFQSSSHAVLD
jgi:hypothetical protein